MLATSLNEVLGIRFPEPKKVTELNVDVTEIRPIERRADTVMMTDNRRTARWARQPINVGLAEAPSQITRPLVLGPDNVPMITTVDQACADVALAVLSALTHRHSPDVKVILEALDAALNQEDLWTAGSLAEFTEVGLGDTMAFKEWRGIMGTMAREYQSELRRKGRAEGLQEGRLQEAAAAVLRVLEARGLAAREDVARRVNDCTSLSALEDLLVRAATTERAEDIFADPIA